VPLKAIVEGETIIGPEFSADGWADLRLRHKKGLMVTMACCGAPGHLRVSKKGTQHFYHAADAGCSYAEESREHLEIKYQIYRICKSENWETSVEFPAPDRTWISDVYATREGRNVVFEIQISRISPDDLEERDRKYRNKGIESYWLLENFLERSKDFESWYDHHLFEGGDRPGEPIPYIDDSLFKTGPENHIYIPKGIRSVGLSAKDQTLFTTSNPEIPLAVWVREVLKGNYRKYLEDTSAAYHRKRRLLTMAAPALFRFREFFEKIIRRKIYREKAGHLERIFKTGPLPENDRAFRKKVRDLYAEIDWLEKEYHSCMSGSSGLFTWKKVPEYRTPKLYFRLESESNVKKLQACVGVFEQWERAFERAAGAMERELPPKKTMKR
jgi:hypothetical protein